jgi:NAD+ diphosphatase
MSRESIYKRYEPAVTLEPGDSQRAYWFVFGLNKLLIKEHESKPEIPYTGDPGEWHLVPARIQYLGSLQGSPCYCAEAPAETRAPEGMSFRELRSLWSALDEDLFLLAGRALQIVSWDQTHQYCGRCGIKTELVQDERAKKCPACGLICYPRLSPATITAIFKDDKILLTHNIAFRGNVHSLVAGFVEPGETLEECVRREILEEVGLRVKNIQFFGSQPWPFPNSLMIGFTAEYESGDISVDGKEISRAGWYDVNNLPEIPSKISIAREIIDSYIQRYSGGVE